MCEDNGGQSEIILDCNTEDNNELLESFPVVEEIARCRTLYDKRQALKRQKAIDIKPLYYDRMKRRDLLSKYPVYKFLCTYPKPPTNYTPCHHIGQIILDRDILTKDEYIDFLAQPKENLGRPVKQIKCCYEKRFLPNCTSRISSLAYPKDLRVRQNWQDYKHVLSARQATNLRRNIHRLPLEITSIENTLVFIHEEKRLRAEARKKSFKKCNQIKRKLLKMQRQQMTKIIFALYEVMKKFLVTDQYVISDSKLDGLCKVLETKIIEFSGIDNSETSHLHCFIKTVSQNLAIWIEKFTSNCGFRSAECVKETMEKEVGDPCKTPEKQECMLPVADFIPYESPSMTNDGEDVYTEYGGEYEEEN